MPDAETRSRVLLVEDDPDLRLLFCLHLRASADVVDVSDVQGALAAIESDRFSVVVTDLLLDGGDARELLTRLKAMDTSVVVVTGLEGPERARRLHGLPVTTVLTKPVTVEDLRAAILTASEHDR